MPIKMIGVCSISYTIMSGLTVPCLGAFETAPPAILEPKPTPASSGFSNLGFANGSSYPSRLQPSSHTNTPSRTPTPASLAATRGTDSAWGENAKTPSPAPPSLSKEEKAAEMAKRKEERKQVRFFFFINTQVELQFFSASQC
jgi:hypothetical protein